MVLDIHQLVEVPEILPQLEVLRRIDLAVRNFLANGGIQVGGLTDPELWENKWRVSSYPQRDYFVSSVDQIRNFLRILNIVTRNVRDGIIISVRELYYRQKGLDGWLSCSQVSSMLTFIQKLLVLPRISMGLCAGSKGLVIGNISITHVHSNTIENAYNRVYSIDNCAQVSGAIALHYDASFGRPKFILVVEKEAIFQLFVQHQAYKKLQCIIITGRGMPCLSTRGFLHVASETFNIPVFGLTDWNPYGYNIMLTYAHGGREMLEGYHFAVPSLRILGLRFEHIERLNHNIYTYFQPITDQDRSLAHGISLRYSDSQTANLVEEMNHMVRVGYKLELEILNNLEGRSSTYLADEWIFDILVQCGII